MHNNLSNNRVFHSALKPQKKVILRILLISKKLHKKLYSTQIETFCNYNPMPRHKH